MNETRELWKGYREEQRERRAKRLPLRTAQIAGLALRGYRIEKLTPYQFRINGELDVYPIHNCFHILKSGKRVGIETLSRL